jgi:hypothetical protein
VTLRLRRGGIAAALAVAATLLAVPAAQAGCTPQPADAHPFATFDDTGVYTLIGGGDFEGDLSAWTLTGGAHPVADNNPFLADGAAAVALGPGDSVTTAPICIDDTYPWFRFFANNQSRGKGKVKIEILYTDLKGKAKSKNADDYVAPDAGWMPSDAIGIDVNWDHAGATVPVQFRFTAQSNSSFELDDVYVDPMARG